MSEPLYRAEGDVVFKRPVETETANGRSIALGFPVCTASEYVSAEVIAAVLNAGDTETN